MRKYFTRGLVVASLSVMLALGTFHTVVRADEADNPAANGTEVVTEADDASQTDAEIESVLEDASGTDAFQNANEQLRGTATEYVITYSAVDGYIFGEPDTYSCTFNITKGNMIGDNIPYTDRPGYYVAGWQSEKTGRIYTPLALSTYVPQSDDTFSACWTAAYNITFRSPEGYLYSDPNATETVIKHSKGTSIRYDVPYCERPGYTISGWKSEKTGKIYACYRSPEFYNFVPTEDDTFTAVWAEAYTVTFQFDEGSYIDNPTATSMKDYVIKGTATEFSPQLEKTGYAHSGWTLAGTNDVYYSEWNEDLGLDANYIWDYVPTADVTFVANWTEAYKITFKSAAGYIGGEPYCKETVVSVAKGSHIKLPEFRRPGYAVLGFKDEKNGKTYSYRRPVGASNLIEDFIPDSDTTFIFQWKEAYQVTVRYDGADASDCMLDEEVYYVPKGYSMEYSDYSYSWPTSAEKKEFMGYKIEGDTSGRIFYKGEATYEDDGIFKYIPQSDITLVPVWEDGYYVTIDGDGGYHYIGTNGDYIEYGGKKYYESLSYRKWVVAKGTDLVLGNYFAYGIFDEGAVFKEGYDFAGWVVVGKEDKVYSFGEPIKINSDMTIKALWKKKGQKNGFVKKGNDWEYYVNDKLYTDSDKTLVNGTINGKKDWYKVKNGKFDKTFSGIAKATNGAWYYVKNGVMDKTFTGKIALATNGVWYYVTNGKPDTKFSGVALATNGIWYYVSAGKINKTYTGAAKATNGIWYYVKASKIDKTFNGIAKATDGNWYYMVSGKQNKTFNGIAKATNGAWYYVKNGAINKTYVGVAKATTGVMYYVKNSKIDKTFTGIAKGTDNKSYYVKAGKVDKTFTGTYKYNGKTYKIVKGVVQ